MAEESTTSEQKAAEPTAEPALAPVAVAEKKPSPAKKKKAPLKKGNGKLSILTADVILAKQDIKEEEMEIEEWEGTVIVRGLSSVAHEKLVQSAMRGPIGARDFNMVGYQAKVCVLCAYNGFTKDGGERIFEDAHVPMLQEKASGPVSKIAQKAQELSGIGGTALEKLRANLGQTPSEDSLSD